MADEWVPAFAGTTFAGGLTLRTSRIDSSWRRKDRRERAHEHRRHAAAPAYRGRSRWPRSEPANRRGDSRRDLEGDRPLGGAGISRAEPDGPAIARFRRAVRRTRDRP